MIDTKAASGPNRRQAGDDGALTRFGQPRHQAEGEEERDRRGGTEPHAEHEGHRGEQQATGCHQPAGAEPVREPASWVGAAAPHDVESGPDQRHSRDRHTLVLEPEDEEGFREAKECDAGEGEYRRPE